MNHAPFILCACGLLGGLMLLLVARRGRRIGIERVCRRCDYNLAGLSPDSESCPECGSKLRKAKAICIGHKKSRPMVGVMAILMILPSVLGLTHYGKQAAAEIDWQRHKPLWWLIRDSGSGDVARRDAAIGEMLRRINANSLSQGQVERISHLAIAHQSDVSRSWLASWGDLVEHAHASGKLSEATWKQYCIGSVALSVSVRPKIRRGDPMVLTLDVLSARASATGGVHGVTVFSPRDLKINGVSLTPNAPKMWSSVTFHASGVTEPRMTWHLEVDEQRLKGLADGPQQLEGEIPVSVYNRYLPNPMTEKGAPVADIKVKVSSRFILLPADQPSVQLVKDDSLEIAVENSIVVAHSWQTGSRLTRVGDQLSSAIRPIGNPPIDMACDVLLRSGSQEWLAGQFLCDTAGHGGSSIEATVPGLRANLIDVVLRPSASAAAATMDMNRIWGKEIVLHNVPIYGNDNK